MSIKVMSAVWDLKLPAREKFVLLKLADNAHDDGSNAHPSIAYVAHKCGESERTVSRLLQRLTDRGVLEVQEPAGRRTPTIYHVRPDRGDKLTPLRATGGVTKPTVRGDKTSRSGVTKRAENDDHSITEPSLLTVREPSRGQRVPTRPLSDQDLWDLCDEYADRLGGTESVGAAIAKAQNAGGYRGARDKLAYLRDWLEEDATKERRHG